MYNVLVCDDDKDIVEAISIYLETAGYAVVKAYDGFEALEGVIWFSSLYWYTRCLLILSSLIFENSSERISIVYVLIALLPIIFYLIFNHYMITYYIMMVFNLLDYIIIRIVGLPKNEKWL